MGRDGGGTIDAVRRPWAAEGICACPGRGRRTRLRGRAEKRAHAGSRLRVQSEDGQHVGRGHLSGGAGRSGGGSVRGSAGRSRGSAPGGRPGRQRRLPAAAEQERVDAGRPFDLAGQHRRVRAERGSYGHAPRRRVADHRIDDRDGHDGRSGRARVRAAFGHRVDGIDRTAKQSAGRGGRVRGRRGYTRRPSTGGGPAAGWGRRGGIPARQHMVRGADPFGWGTQ